MTRRYWFDTPPEAIQDAGISETLDTDIVVLGCGIAGSVAALSAAEEGAQVVLLEKTATFNARGRGNFAFGCRLRPPLGDEVPNPSAEQVARRRNEIVAEIMLSCGYRGDQRLANFLVDHAGQVYDWILDIAEREGVEVEARKNTVSIQKNGEYQEVLNLSGNKQFHYDVIFQPNGQQTMVGMIVAELEKKANVTIRYNAKAEQLLRDETGKIDGVVAQLPDGTYLKVNAKAVILATGGYEWDAEMVEKYGGMGLYVASISYENEANTGDGQKMGMWVGAKMDEAPNCFLFEDAGGYHLYTDKNYGIGVARKPWLAVNAFGHRMDNEDKVWPMIGGSDLYKPGHIKFAVWDDAWRDEAKVERMGSAHSYFSKWHGYTPELTEEMIRRSYLPGGDGIGLHRGVGGSIDLNIMVEDSS